MAQRVDDDRSAALVACFAASAMIAGQVAGKATRDALFLSNFPVTMLPQMVITSALLSVLLVLAWGWLLRRRGPHPLVATTYGVSALLLFAIGALARHAPAMAAFATYLHVAVLGPVLISGFWSLLNERWDPRAAKRTIGRVAAFGSLGGLLGGVLADRVTVWSGTAMMLPVLGGLHLVSAAFISGVRPPGARHAAPVSQDHFDGARVLARTPYLRSLGLLVLLGAMSGALLDYAFKARAASAVVGEEPLMRLFSAFHAGVALLAFATQILASRPLLERAGLARTVAALPFATLGGAALAAWLPGLASVTGARGAENVLRNSLFRSGYELLFTPVPAADRRATKILIDVGFERAGDVLGGALVALLLVAAAADPTRAMLWVTVALSGLALGVALRLHRGYVSTLESSLIAGEVQLDEAQDATTRTVALRTQAFRLPPAAVLQPETRGDDGLSTRTIDLRAVREAILGPRAVEARSTPATVLERAAALDSDDADRIRDALATPLDPALVSHAIALLGRDDVAPDVLRALRAIADRAAGQLGDALLDTSRAPAARRRVARLLGSVGTPRAMEALLHGLDDPRFEVRHRCGVALARLRDADDRLVFDRERVYAAVHREVAVERHVWNSQREMEMLDEPGSPIVDAYLRARASASLEHVFNLLSLVLPPRPLQIAFRGLNGDDRMLRGMALEYLESVLPPEIRVRLWPFLELDATQPTTQRPRDEILADMLRSHESIRIRISELGEEEPQ